MKFISLFTLPPGNANYLQYTDIKDQVFFFSYTRAHGLTELKLDHVPRLRFAETLVGHEDPQILFIFSK